MVNYLITNIDIDIYFFISVIITTIFFFPFYSLSLSINFTNIMQKLRLVMFPGKTNNILMASPGPMESAATGLALTSSGYTQFKSVVINFIHSKSGLDKNWLHQSLDEDDYKTIAGIFNIFNTEKKYIIHYAYKSGQPLNQLRAMPLVDVKLCCTEPSLHTFRLEGKFDLANLTEKLKESSLNKDITEIYLYSHENRYLYKWDGKFKTLQKNKIIYMCKQIGQKYIYNIYDPISHVTSPKSLYIRKEDGFYISLNCLTPGSFAQWSTIGANSKISLIEVGTGKYKIMNLDDYIKKNGKNPFATKILSNQERKNAFKRFE